jgi:hypothetical protein
MDVNGNVNIPFVGHRLPSIYPLWDKTGVCRSLWNLLCEWRNPRL